MSFDGATTPDTRRSRWRYRIDRLDVLLDRRTAGQTSSKGTGVKLSVVIVPATSQSALPNCLKAIASLNLRNDAEVIVAGLEELPAAAAPATRFVPAPSGRPACELRALGARQADGDRIAMLSDRYRAGPEWIGAALEESAFQVVGGGVAPSPDFTFREWCIYLAEYSHLAPPLKPGARNRPKDLAAGNIVYRRDVFDPDLMERCGAELEFHRRMLHSGITFGIHAGLDVNLADIPGWSDYARERYQFSRRIARDRARNLSTWARLAHAAATPLLPLVVLIRTGAAIWTKPAYWLRFAVCFPVLFLFGFVQTAAELSGYLFSQPTNAFD